MRCRGRGWYGQQQRGATQTGTKTMTKTTPLTPRHQQHWHIRLIQSLQYRSGLGLKRQLQQWSYTPSLRFARVCLLFLLGLSSLSLSTGDVTKKYTAALVEAQ